MSFEPRLYEQGGAWFYDDGAVLAAVDITEDGAGRRLLICEWTSRQPGQGHSERALRWLRQEFVHMAANGVGRVDDAPSDSTVNYWACMARKGLVDVLLDDDGQELEVDAEGVSLKHRTASATVDSHEATAREMEAAMRDQLIETGESQRAGLNSRRFIRP